MARGSRAGRFASFAAPLATLASLASLACSHASPAPDAEWEATQMLAGEWVRVTIRHPDEPVARAALAEAFTAAESVATKLLAEGPGNEIDLLRKVPSQLWVEISRPTWEALALAARVARDSDGAYDPTWTPLLRVWGLRGGEPHVPRAFEIEMALRRVDWESVEIRDVDGLEARRLGMRTEIALGALARGAVLDAAVARLRELDVPAAWARTEREHACFGGSDRRPWRVPLPAGILDASVSMRDGGLAVATRGDAIPTADGTPIHARFDPRSGRPVAVRWAVVRADRAAVGAAWADAVLALGPEAPERLAGRPELAAAFAPESGEPWISDDLRASLVGRGD